jgi:hypothetical protein
MEEKGEADYLWRRRKQTIAGVEECTWMPSVRLCPSKVQDVDGALRPLALTWMSSALGAAKWRGGRRRPCSLTLRA